MILLSPTIKQVFDSFELLVAPEVAQVLAQRETGSAAQQVRGTPGGLTQGGATTAGDGLNCEDIPERNFAIDPNSDPNGFDGDNDGIGCETGAFGEVIEPETGGGNVGEDDDSNVGVRDNSSHPSYPDVCIPSPA